MAAIHTAPEGETVPVADIRKHLKKLHNTTDYLQQYCRWNYYRPHPDTQLVFHNSTAIERSVVLGTQQGKTTSCAHEMAFAACDVWPKWHRGLHPKPPAIERAAKFIGWYSSVTSQNVRDGAQQRLLGDISRKDGLGTGAIPLDYIEGITMSRGIANFVDTITVRRETGGYALLQSKTYEQSVLSYQGVPVDLAWVDEDPGYDDRIYNELLGRTIAANGRIIVSLTPMLGMTPIRKRFVEGDGKRIFQVRGGIDQALHIPKERHQAIIDATPERERAARLYGLEMQGQGAVFDTPVSQVKYERPPEHFPLHWPVVWGLDFNHGGSSAEAHPFVAAFAFYDQPNDVIYIADLIVLHSPHPDQHVMRMRAHACWDAPVLWPHDGTRTGDMKSGDSISQIYKSLGLRMQPTHVTFPEGGYSLEAGLVEMNRRFASGRLLIAKHLSSEFDAQYLNYHYENGKVVRRDDDVLDAIRVVVMGIRHAKSQLELDARREGRGYSSRQHKDHPWDIFTGEPMRSEPY